MDHLTKRLAPISAEAWSQIDDEARRQLTTYLAARQLVDFSGPHGWTWSSVPLGRSSLLAPAPAASPAPSPLDQAPPALSPLDQVEIRQRSVLPAVELRVDFSLSRDELDDAARGADDLDLEALDDAAEQIAIAENVAVFHGLRASIAGLTEASPHPPISLSDDLEQWPTSIAMAVNVLRSSGVTGPYGLAVGPAGWTGIVETPGRGGRSLFEHLGQILGGPLVWAPGVVGAVVMSLRGGDFLFDSGQDISIGYADHDRHTVELYLQESFTFRVAEPDAAVALVG